MAEITPIRVDRFAALSDIHGNRWALEGVLDDIDSRGIDTIVNLGDSFYGPLDPYGTAEMLLPRRIPSVLGNEDQLSLHEHVQLPAADGEAAEGGDPLAPHHRQWLARLPLTRHFTPEILMCHGTPSDNTSYLVWRVGTNRLLPTLFADPPLDFARPPLSLVLCGHSHKPITKIDSYKNEPDNVLSREFSSIQLHNVGSVGLQAFTDDHPIPHIVQTCRPHARYTIAERSPRGWLLKEVLVEYDCKAAAAVAEKNGRTDWAKWLRTGRAD